MKRCDELHRLQPGGDRSSDRGNQPNVTIRVPLLTLIAALLSAVVISGATAQIPPGYEIVHITDNPNDYSRVPRINNCGQITFETWVNQGPGEIFLYDNGKLVSITNDSVFDSWPDINDEGTLVWSRGVGPGQTFEVAMYRDGETTILTDDALEQFSPHINSRGQVAWEAYTEKGCSSAEVFLQDGDAVQQITDNGFSNVSQRLGDDGTLVWTQRDFCSSPWNYRVMMYKAGDVQELSTGEPFAQLPVINNDGWVVWQFDIAPGESALQQSANSETGLLLDWGSNAAINNAGDMYFIRWHEESATYQGWLCLDCGPSGNGVPTLVQLTDDGFSNVDGDINDHAEVAWQARNFPVSDIYFLRRIRNGDADFDGDIDIDDFSAMKACMTQPTPTDRLCECRFLDLDHDRDVDMHDFHAFQLNYTGGN